MIDVILVCAGALFVFALRFGFHTLVDVSTSGKSRFFGEPSHGYASVLLLYCSLIVLACMSQGLYRTPREISAFLETERAVSYTHLTLPTIYSV